MVEAMLAVPAMLGALGAPKFPETPHGTRARYTHGCRCPACREANRLYYHECQRRAKELARELERQGAPARQGGGVTQRWTPPGGTPTIRVYRRACPGVFGKPCATRSHLRSDSTGGICGNCLRKLFGALVPADRAREHILALGRKGIGYKTVADAAKVATSIVANIRSGEKRRIRAETERRLLAVDEGCAADRDYIPAGETWRRIRDMLDWGYTKSEIAERLGYKTRALQFPLDRVTTANASRVKKLWEELRAERLNPVPDYCPRCGREHTPAVREVFLRRVLPQTIPVLKLRWPCCYGEHLRDAGERMLYRDLRRLGCREVHGTWYLPGQSLLR
jgi:hypothetical protein